MTPPVLNAGIERVVPPPASDTLTKAVRWVPDPPARSLGVAAGRLAECGGGQGVYIAGVPPVGQRCGQPVGFPPDGVGPMVSARSVLGNAQVDQFKRRGPAGV